MAVALSSQTAAFTAPIFSTFGLGGEPILSEAVDWANWAAPGSAPTVEQIVVQGHL
jgi:hypothetical protein